MSSLLHVVAFTLEEGFDRADPEVRAAMSVSAAHPNHIPAIRTWWCGEDTSGRPGAFDYVVVSTFDDEARLAEFQAHPHHAVGKELWARVATWRVIDVLTG